MVRVGSRACAEYSFTLSNVETREHLNHSQFKVPDSCTFDQEYSDVKLVTVSKSQS